MQGTGAQQSQEGTFDISNLNVILPPSIAVLGKMALYNVKNYGAKGGGNDDRVAIQRAYDDMFSAPNMPGALYFPADSYGVSIAGKQLGVDYSISLGNGPVPVIGSGADVTTIKLLNGQITAASTQYFMFATNGQFNSGTWTLQDITIDGNGQNQNFASYTGSTYFGILTTLNEAGSVNGYLRACRTHFLNWSMLGTNTIAHGTAINTFGFARQHISDCYFDNCDYSVFITQSAQNEPNHTVITGTIHQNIGNLAVYSEGFSDIIVSDSHFFNDALITSGSSRQSAGVVVFANQIIRRVLVSNCSFTNLQIPVLLGLGGGNLIKDSVFSDLAAYNCRGGFVLSGIDETTIVNGITADTCALGGISGTTVYGSVEVNNGFDATAYAVLRNITSIASGNAGISMLGKGEVIGGHISGSTGSAVTFNNQANTIIRSVSGYNPVGFLGAPVVPASGTAFQNPYGVDAVVYLAGGTGVSIAVGPTAASATVTGMASGPIAISATAYIKVSYTGAPSWNWFN